MMAGVSAGTEVLYKRESKLGLTTLTFRKRRYVLPRVIIKGDHPLSASTGDLQTTGKCVMLDVGMFCPHCAGAISATLSGSHSKLVISRGNASDHQCTESIEEGPRRLQLEHTGVHESGASTTEGQTASSLISSSAASSKQATIKKIKTESSVSEGTLASVDTLDTQSNKYKSSDDPETSDKLSSSDYASLDRDSCFNSSGSYGHSTDTCVSVPSCGTIMSNKVDDAYASLPSSYQSITPEPHTQGLGQSTMSSLGSGYPSLPRDACLASNGYSSSEERLILDSMQVDVSDANDEVLVDELLSDEVIDDEYHTLMNGSTPGDTNAVRVNDVGGSTIHSSSESENQRKGLVSDDSFDFSRSDDNLSERSASPEVFVDDVLENMDSEIISGDATLRRVFAIQKSGSSKRLKQTSENLRHPHSLDIFEPDTPKRKPKPGEILIEGTASLRRRKLHELVKTKYKNIQKHIKLSSQQKTDFSHEQFFDDVMEALTDLEGGFTDWASDHDSNTKELMHPGYDSRTKFMLGEQEDNDYKDTLDVYDIPRKTATSSCECLADDQSRYIDSSMEHIPSTTETPSEESLEGDGSSSECSDSGRNDHLVTDELFQQLINDTQHLTDDLKVINNSIEVTSSGESSVKRLVKQSSLMRDQCDIIDEVFVGDSGTLLRSRPVESAKLEYQYALNTQSDMVPIPTILEPSGANSDISGKRRSRSGEESSCDDELDSSLENLLTCNKLHCSTSDLDEPFNAELHHANLVQNHAESTVENMKADGSKIDQDFQKCLLTKSREIDEFVPEKLADETSNVTLNQANKDTSNKFDNAVKSGEWKNLTKETDTKVATFESKDDMSKEQAQEFMKYVLSQSCQTHHSKEHSTDLDTCLDQVCQTCAFKPNTSDEIVKNEEVTTKEVTLVFAWPKHMKIPRELSPPVPKPKPDQPFRTIHLRRVMRVSDFDMEVIEGPTIQTVEYTKDGPAKKSITMTAHKISEENGNELDDSNRKVTQNSDKELAVTDTSVPPSLGDSLLLDPDVKTPKNVINVTNEHNLLTHTDNVSGCLSNNNENSEIVEAELSHYNTMSESFKMPENCDTQKSELLFDESSSVSRKLMMDTESKIDLVYEDHQKALNKIYEQAEIDAQQTDQDVDGSAAGLIANEDGDKQTDDKSQFEHHEYRLSESDIDNDPKATFIDQNRRNVMLVDVGKYFSSQAHDGTHEDSTQPSAVDGPEQMAIVQETICPRCSDIYLFDDNQKALRASQTDLMDVHLLTRESHPVPCERCIRLEREIKIKLEELWSMVEKLGRRKSLTENKGTSITESIEDIESMSMETVENIQQLQRSISSLEDINVGDKLTSSTSSNMSQITDMSSHDHEEDDRPAVVGPVSYSTTVIKKKKPKKAPKPKGVVINRDNTGKVTYYQHNQVNSNVVETCDIVTQIDDKQLQSENVMPTHNSQHKPTDEESTSETVTGGEPPTFDQQLDTFSENFSKYIIFRAKLAIVLENPSTRIPCLQNELAGHLQPDDSTTTAPKEIIMDANT